MRRSLSGPGIFVATLAVLLAVTGIRADEARIIPLKHRTAAEVIPLIRPLLDPDDALTGTDYRLIIRTSEKNLGEIERILKQVDIAREQLRITVEQSVAGDDDRTSHSVAGELNVGDHARIALPRKSPDDGRLVVKKDGLRYSAVRRNTTARNASTQMLLTQDGQRAYIRIGQSIPHVQRILALSRHQAVLIQGIAMQDVTTGFDVLPRVRGDRVLVEITPRLSSLQNPATGLVNYQELSTTVETRRGEWLDLGQILGSRNEVSRAILESASTTEGEQRRVRLRIE